MKQGDIVMIPFPFTDLSSKKTRPALVVSNDSLYGNDYILAGITSKNSSGARQVVIDNSDLVQGELPLTSYVRVGKLATLNKNIVRAVVAKLNENKMKMIIENILFLIEFD